VAIVTENLLATSEI